MLSLLLLAACNSGGDTSTKENSDPVPTILSPVDGQEVVAEAPLTATGTASDADAGTVTTECQSDHAGG